MVTFTAWLGILVLLLLALNFLVSLLPKRKQVKVTFIPPAPANTPAVAGGSNPWDAHVRSINTKITQLFSRVEELEHRMQEMESPSSEANEWIETVPVRAGKR